MIALIAEKPSVAKDIARIIGATQRNDGYLSGNGYMVTWAFGHLIQLAMPEAYGVANFRRESLPIIPADFRLIPRQTKAEKGYKADPGVLKQLINLPLYLPLSGLPQAFCPSLDKQPDRQGNPGGHEELAVGRALRQPLSCRHTRLRPAV